MATVTPANWIKQLNWRYATKKFDPAKRIPADLWKTMEQALILAPSSYGLQPWKFIVVNDATLRQQLRAASWNQPQITDASHLVVFASKRKLSEDDAEKLVQHTAKIRNEPVTAYDGYKKMIVGSINGNSADQQAVWASRQTYIALGFFLASAALLEIDACPMEGISGPDYDRILGLDKQGYQTVCVATAGYRAADDKYAAAAKVRYPEADVLARV